MRKQLRQIIIKNLWESYRQNTRQISLIEGKLKQKGMDQLFLDHFAVIDLPSEHTGIHCMQKIFAHLDYVEQGKDYLPDKQNDFLWMTEVDCIAAPAKQVLPQVVVADFRLDELPTEIRKIIVNYANCATAFPFSRIEKLFANADHNPSAAKEIIAIIVQYFTGRDWPLPKVAEFNLVKEFNELLAWVLVFGRRPNHFTLSIHLLEQFANLNDFLTFIRDECALSLNHEGGTIKGGKHSGIAQGSTCGEVQKIALADGWIEIPTGFVEFVWRYPSCDVESPLLWQEYFTGFIAQHADHVIESLSL